jgi:hypothetical protein
MRFEQTGQLADLEESIGFHEEALELSPGSLPNRSGSLNNLANVPWMVFEQMGIGFHQEALALRSEAHYPMSLD